MIPQLNAKPKRLGRGVRNQRDVHERYLRFVDIGINLLGEVTSTTRFMRLRDTVLRKFGKIKTLRNACMQVQVFSCRT
jgi:hypothetical protein